jgi:hypothetical protein
VPRLRLILLSTCALLAFDVILAFASRFSGIKYSSASIFSFVLYALIGYIASRPETLLFGVLTATVCGAADASLGWWLSWIIGPGRWINLELTSIRWLFTFLFMLLLSSLFGFTGAVFAYLRKASLKLPLSSCATLRSAAQ